MKTRSVTTLIGTIVAAILASSCCIGPLILAGLGIGSIGAFSSLGKYRPLFIIMTFAFIGMAFYFTYRKKSEVIACCASKTNMMKKVTLLVITVIAVGMLFFPYVYGSFGKSVSNVKMGDNMKNVNRKQEIISESIITCPECGFARKETMPTDSCQIVYECTQCKTILRPKKGDCCVYCSYGSVPCPPIQCNNDCCL